MLHKSGLKKLISLTIARKIVSLITETRNSQCTEYTKSMRNELVLQRRRRRPWRWFEFIVLLEFVIWQGIHWMD